MKTSFSNFLTEAIQSSDVDDIIQDCQPFLENFKELYKAGNFLYRGYDSRGNFKYGVWDTVIYNRTRLDRRPKDSSRELHGFLDEYFQETFGFEYRSKSVFTTPKEFIARDYSNHVYIVFPSGKYTLCYSHNIKDAYDDLGTANGIFYRFAKHFDEEKSKQILEVYNIYPIYRYLRHNSFESALHNVNIDAALHAAIFSNDSPLDERDRQGLKKLFYEVLNFEESTIIPESVYNKGHEVMIKCDGWYGIHVKDENNLNKLLAEI